MALEYGNYDIMGPGVQNSNYNKWALEYVYYVSMGPGVEVYLN